MRHALCDVYSQRKTLTLTRTHHGPLCIETSLLLNSTDLPTLPVTESAPDMHDEDLRGVFGRRNSVDPWTWT